MTWIYLSPHFDDVALSCGGLLWEQTHADMVVVIWTICAGSPPRGKLSPFAQELHARWEINKNAPTRRKIEDAKSCHRLGAGCRYFSIPDCIYRRHPTTGEFMYASEAALNGSLHPGDAQVLYTLVNLLSRSLSPEVLVISPLALGDHVDHQLTRQAAERLGLRPWYYADYPYVLRFEEQLRHMHQADWVSQVFPISQAGLDAWQDSIAAHGSQISTFWPNEPAMRQAIVEYLQSNGGIRLWRKPAG